MAAFRIEWKPSALRELKKLDRQVISRIIEAIESLAENPFPHGIKKLYGSEHTYRLRIGHYRVIYEVFTSRLLIEIVRVRHRKEVYR